MQLIFNNKNEIYTLKLFRSWHIQNKRRLIKTHTNKYKTDFYFGSFLCRF
jgi:hypothetical protein